MVLSVISYRSVIVRRVMDSRNTNISFRVKHAETAVDV